MKLQILHTILIAIALAQFASAQQPAKGGNCNKSKENCVQDTDFSYLAQPVDAVVQNWTDFIQARRASVHFAWTVAGDHENAGVFTEGGGPYLGVEAVHSVFKVGDFSLEVPAGAAGRQILYAPTTRPPNGSCLEMGTAYTTLAGQPTSVYVYVYDSCKAPTQFIYAAPVNEKFIQLYGGETVDGMTGYKLRIMPSSTSLSTQTEWSAQLFNFAKHEWETIAVSQGFVTDLSGWSIFETWYQKGQCSKTLKSIKAVDISYYDALANSWKAISDEMLPLRNSVRGGGNCFVDQDPNNQASYKVMPLPAVHGWEVTGTGH
jgi:hypothetical protein